MFKDRDYAEDWRVRGEECPAPVAFVYYLTLGCFFAALIAACWGVWA